MQGAPLPAAHVPATHASPGRQPASSTHGARSGEMLVGQAASSSAETGRTRESRME